MAFPMLAHPFRDALPEMTLPVPATSFPHARLLCLNEKLAHELGLDSSWLRSTEGVQWLTGGAGGVATAYAGHQFGNFVPRLGDGRAMLLGVRNGFELQTKGSGRTPFSRPGSDGFGALGPMLREYAVAGFMDAIGIPTTRCLAVLATGETVRRTQGALPGGIVVRVARSHLRIGSVQYAAMQSEDLVRRIVEFAGFLDADCLLADVAQRQLTLVARWMRVGFVHGVMNTDNITLSGETIDYGPCAFTPRFDLDSWYSSIDHTGRYRFGNQPNAVAFGLQALAEALGPLLDEETTQHLFHNLQSQWDTYFQEATAGVASRLARARDIATLNREVGLPWCSAKHGPLFVPRNFMLDDALRHAERHGDLTPFEQFYDAITDPFSSNAGPAWMSQPEEENRPFVTYCGT